MKIISSFKKYSYQKILKFTGQYAHQIAVFWLFQCLTHQLGGKGTHHKEDDCEEKEDDTQAQKDTYGNKITNQ